MFDKTYYLGSQDDGKDAYRLLHDALDKTGRAGIGRWVFHNREYLVAVRALGDVLAMHTMRFHDELVPAEDLDIASPSRKPSKRELEMAGKLVETLAGRVRPDEVRGHLPRAAARVHRGEGEGQARRAAQARPTPRIPDDLMAALEASVAGGKG